MFDFSGKTVVITGADRGIGKSIAELFLHGGACLIGTYHTNKAAAEQFQEENQKFSKAVSFHQLDVSDYHQVEEFFRFLETTYKSFQILVNNSGIRKDAIVGMMKEADWKSVIDVNFPSVTSSARNMEVLSILPHRAARQALPVRLITRLPKPVW
jgi:3-oxoacyl-[acyl-carrier protein] reductase